MNQKKAKLLHKLAVKISRDGIDVADMKITKKAVRKEVVDSLGNPTKKVVQSAKFQRVLRKNGPRSIKRRLKKLYVQKKIKLSLKKHAA